MMDYDGAEQASDGDVTTRGMLVYACNGNVARRYYLNVYPTLSGATSLGGETTTTGKGGCGAG